MFFLKKTYQRRVFYEVFINTNKEFKNVHDFLQKINSMASIFVHVKKWNAIFYLETNKNNKSIPKKKNLS